jgi:hypothetical protein
MKPLDLVRHVNFHVLAADALPGGYRLKACCLCSDGCCDLVRCQYQCGAERMLLVQCCCGYPLCCGKRTVLRTRVHGKPARIVQCDGHLAGVWLARGTAVALIGPRDLADLVRLMAEVDRRLEAKS